MPETRQDFRELQYRFTAHIRDPDRQPPPAGVEERRLKVYRELVYDNVESLISNSFPVLRSVIDDGRWHDAIRDYFRRHQSRTPLFPRIPQEFLQYLSEEREDPGDPPFMLELAHYEWLEVEVSLDKREIDEIEVAATADVMTGVPVLSPLCRAHAYRYPVHAIGPSFAPDAAPSDATYLIVYRDRDDEVGFMQLNPVTARLVELITGNSRHSGVELLESIATELRHPRPEVVVNGGRATMQRLLAHGVLVGARRRRRAGA